jgi:transposase
MSQVSAGAAIPQTIAPAHHFWVYRIHVGSKEAGPRLAAIILVVETCRHLKISVRNYLGSVLPGLADFPISRIAELTLTAWATRN